MKSLPNDVHSKVVALKADELFDAWLATYGDEDGDTLPSYAEELLLSDYDQQHGTNLLEQAKAFYDMMGQVICFPKRGAE